MTTLTWTGSPARRMDGQIHRDVYARIPNTEINGQVSAYFVHMK